MSAQTFGQKRFTPTPPDKGSFPLDHDNVCKSHMLKYMNCVRKNRDDSTVCRNEAKEYLSCRMDNNLMAKEEWKSLGFSESTSEKSNKSN